MDLPLLEQNINVFANYLIRVDLSFKLMATTKHRFILEVKCLQQHIKAINYLIRSIMATTFTN